FTYCQVPVIYSVSNENQITVEFISGQTKTFNTLRLSNEISEKIFNRTGEVDHILVHVDKAILK
ncbi:MAG: hypothetical protein KJO29_05250, partial [Bacteroidia bacterium]|nr:hypothetical protein [Bacteroidia bacterium]